jgi:hypothetical protein
MSKCIALNVLEILCLYLFYNYHTTSDLSVFMIEINLIYNLSEKNIIQSIKFGN